ncbi:MAG: hypothetical protein PWQ84_1730 [Thermotogaceae bacterium]|jgi:hypothetical protein|nr:hypothetical protein [Thermotogaceae bacterium]
MELNDIINLNKMVARDLFLLSNEASGIDSVFSPFLVYPSLRTDKVPFRLSEQEARMLYIRKLNELGLYHSIETPTVNLYQQTGTKGLSARIDLTIFNDKTNNGSSHKALERDVNVEFKTTNCNPANIKKDMEKFSKEKVTGNWFHVLKNVDSRTLNVLFDKFVQSMSFFAFTKPIVFCFAIFDKRFSLLKVYDPSKKEPLKDFFDFKLSVKNGSVTIVNANGWEFS